MTTPQRQTVLFDFDDTLVYCGRYYEQVKQRFFDWMAERGMEREQCAARFNELDIANLTRRTLTIKTRFPTTMGQLYQQYCKESGRACLDSEIQEAMAIGYSVYDIVFEAMPGACQMLEDLSKTHDLCLYTSGDQDIQIKRILAVGFDHFFQAVGVPDRKTARALTRFLLANQIKPKDLWVVGNSRKSDIAPALEVGVPPQQCILVDSYSWAADEAEIEAPVHVVRDLSQVAMIIYAAVPQVTA